MANGNPMFTNNQDTLFSPEQLRHVSSENPISYNDAFGQYAPPVFGDTNTVTPGILPRIFVDEGDATTLNGNRTVNENPGDVDNGAGTDREVTIDNVFRHPITNDPEIVDRAAKAMTRDIEGMILYMAVMQHDSQQLMQVTDPATVSALQTSIDKEMTKAEQRITKKLKEFGINEETAKSIFDLLETMKTKLSNGGDRPSDQTFPAV